MALWIFRNSWEWTERGRKRCRSLQLVRNSAQLRLGAISARKQLFLPLLWKLSCGFCSCTQCLPLCFPSRSIMLWGCSITLGKTTAWLSPRCWTNSPNPAWNPSLPTACWSGSPANSSRSLRRGKRQGFKAQKLIRGWKQKRFFGLVEIPAETELQCWDNAWTRS